LAVRQDTAFAEVLTKAVEIGLDVLLERDTRVNVWRKTSLKSEVAKILDSMPEKKLIDAVNLLQSLIEE
jgi:hypothetical protein